MFNKGFFFWGGRGSPFENRAFREIMWKNIVEPDGPLMTKWPMSLSCCIIKAKNTHSECVILITFLRQQWLQERPSVLRYMYIACLVR